MWLSRHSLTLSGPADELSTIREARRTLFHPLSDEGTVPNLIETHRSSQRSLCVGIAMSYIRGLMLRPYQEKTPPHSLPWVTQQF